MVGNFGFFQHLCCRKTSKKLKGGRFGREKIYKELTMPKKTERGPFSLSRYCMLRGKRRKTFLVQFARPNDSIWDHKIS